MGCPPPCNAPVLARSAQHVMAALIGLGVMREGLTEALRAGLHHVLARPYASNQIPQRCSSGAMCRRGFQAQEPASKLPEPPLSMVISNNLHRAETTFDGVQMGLELTAGSLS